MTLHLLSKHCLSQCTDLLNNSILPEYKEGNDRPLDENYFTDLKVLFESISQKIYDQINDGCTDSNSVANSYEIRYFLLSLYIYCGEHSEESYWTSKSTNQICLSLLKIVLGSPDKYLSYLVTDSEVLLKRILTKLRPCLLADTWKTFPTAVRSYSWLLKLLEPPYIGHNLDSLLPTALIITDDFEIPNKIIGIECLHHIIENTTCADLRLRSHDAVIYKALEMCLHEKNACFITLLGSCLFTFFDKMFALSTDHYSQWTFYDDLFTKYLYLIKIESRIDVKTALVTSLTPLLTLSGMITVRYLAGIIEIMDECSVNALTVLPTLDMMNELVCCTPLFEHYLKDMAFIIFKIFYSLKTYKSISEKNITERCKAILIRIFSLQPLIISNIIADQENYMKLNAEIKSLINNIIQTR